MTDNSIAAVERIVAARRAHEPDPAARQPEALTPRQAQHAASPTPEGGAEGGQPSPRAFPQILRDIRLRFKVEPNTGQVVVLLVDTATRRVVRTIPPDELRRLGEGQLVELLT